MGYIKKHQHISLSALREVFVGYEEHEEGGEPSQNALLPIDTLKNRSDLGTKAFLHARHWTLIGIAQMMSLQEVRRLNAANRSAYGTRS